MPPDGILRALGRVAAVSSGIEDQLHELYWQLLDVKDDMGRIITGDMRSSRMTEDILKLARASGRPTPIVDDLVDLFADFREKNQRRNQVIHWIWNEQGVEAPSYKPGQQKQKYTEDDLNTLADDLIWIETRLASHTTKPDKLLAERKKLGTDADMYAPAPWLRQI